jgi:hypothetical protein
MANVIGLKHGDFQVSGSKEGTHYDNCPNEACGKRDVERKWKIGGTSQRTGENYLNAAIYGCPPQDGGCGSTWTRTTRQGVAHDATRGVRSKWGTQDVQRDRTVSVPSEQFRANYSKIDWSK